VNKDMYHPSRDMLEPRMALPKGKFVVCMVPAWGIGMLQFEAGLLAEKHQSDQSGDRSDRWTSECRCDNLPRKIPYYHLNQSSLVIKQ
jgi:hypothetical protein